jgi:hypothetical protein
MFSPVRERDLEQTALLLRRLLDSIDEGELTADGPVGAGMVRRLEGALLALDALRRPGKATD